MMEDSVSSPRTPFRREELEQIARLFSVFSEATRLGILQALREGPLCVSELVAELGTTQANISKQLQVLHGANLLHREKRGTSAYYSINDKMIFPLCELVCDKLNRDRAQQPEDFKF